MLRTWGISLALTSAVVAFGCADKPDVPTSDGSGANGSHAGSGGTGAGGSGTGGGMVMIPQGGSPASSEGGAGSGDTPCDALECGEGQRCVDEQGTASCVDNTCDDLDCSSTEECQTLPAGGATCKSIACKSDVECPESRHCDGARCVDDVCEPDTRTCNGDSVLVCASDGGTNAPAYECQSAGYFESRCEDASAETAAGCGCEGDWDCPEFTVCDVSTCVGTDVEPTCTLPPARFEDVLPKLEFRWGGTSSTSPDATDKAFSWSAQVGATPVVINLDDDNQDGLIDERDFPEILFVSYPSGTGSGAEPGVDGTIRAVHGGGPNKGQDYFALCGHTHWMEGEPAVQDCDPNDSNAQSQSAAIVRAAGMPAAGDLDGDGIPEIVAGLENGGFQILDNRGQIIFESDAGLWPSGDSIWKYPAPAIANLDFDGLAEIVVGNRVVKLKKDSDGKFGVDRVFAGQLSAGIMHNAGETQHHGPTVCLADLVSAPGLEIVAGTTVYRLPDEADCDAEPDSDYCQGELSVVWDGHTVNPDGTFYREGFCAVADVLGADGNADPGPANPLDGTPEVLVMADGHLLIFGSADGHLWRDLDLKGGQQGGAPNVDDFDGDGFPEIATALSDFYVVTDLQTPEPTNCPAWPSMLRAGKKPPDGNPPRDPGGACSADSDCNDGAVCNKRAGQCVCLQSGWLRDTEDDSSKVTSSSVFDFNGDGAAEVVYNDECYFRIYDGATGGTYLQLPSLSRTIIENPVVADVDNDGNAEIVFVQNNETLQCNEKDLDSWPDGNNDVPRESLPNGIEVWGDPSDVWVAARRIWNEHGYHVTNVTEGGRIPLHEPESWKPLNGRVYNTYRSQPRNYGVAPDLTLTAIQISSPNVACGELSDQIDVTVLVKNQGDLRVGPGVQISFSGAWQDPAFDDRLRDSQDDPITVTLDKSLEPGGSTLVTIHYEAGNNGRDDLPAEVTAFVDSEESERECHEDNNEITAPVEAGEQVADLRLEFGDASGCSKPTVEITVYNDGSAPAEHVLVRIYAGDPSQGGRAIGETTIDGPIEAGESATATVSLDELSRNVTLYGIADPLDTVPECNDANNRAQGPELRCAPIAR